jgi:hypothetical protein
VRSTSITGAAPLNLSVHVPDAAPGAMGGAAVQVQAQAQGQGAALTSPPKASTSGFSLSKVWTKTTLTLTRVGLFPLHPHIY